MTTLRWAAYMAQKNLNLLKEKDLIKTFSISVTWLNYLINTEYLKYHVQIIFSVSVIRFGQKLNFKMETAVRGSCYRMKERGQLELNQ